MKIIVYPKEQLSALMVDNEDIIGIYTWEDANKQIMLLNSLNYKGFNNWRLPSIVELNQLYKDKDSIGSFTSVFYWSSTENYVSNAWVQLFGSGYQTNTIKTNTIRVRAVRNL